MNSVTNEQQTALFEEIEEYHCMLQNAISLGRKEEINMWRRAIQTAKIAKRRLANS